MLQSNVTNNYSCYIIYGLISHHWSFLKWWITMVDGGGGGARDVPPLGAISCIFMQFSVTILPDNRLALPYCRVGLTLCECQSWIRHWIRKQWTGKWWNKTQGSKMIPASTEESVVSSCGKPKPQNVCHFLTTREYNFSDETNKWKKEPAWLLARGIVAPPWTPNRRNKELQSGGAEYYCQDFPGITQVKVTVDALDSLMIKGKRNEARIFVVANMMPRDIIFENLWRNNSSFH